jgi:hypothetical protein
MAGTPQVGYANSPVQMKQENVHSLQRDTHYTDKVKLVRHII